MRAARLKNFFKKREKKLGKRLDTGLKIVLYGRPSTLKRGREKKKRLTLKMGLTDKREVL